MAEQIVVSCGFLHIEEYSIYLHSPGLVRESGYNNSYFAFFHTQSPRLSLGLLKFRYHYPDCIYNIIELSKSYND